MSIEAESVVAEAQESVKFTEEFLKRFWSKVNKEGQLPDQSNPHYRGLGRCWEWTAYLRKNGYGEMRFEGGARKAHRVSWRVNCGSIPDGGAILHKCDNPKCVNPNHLLIGTQVENMRDARIKGRFASGDRSPSRLYPEKMMRGDNHYAKLHPEKLARGDRHGSKTHPERVVRGEQCKLSKLTSEIVLEIRRRHAKGGITHQRIADDLGLRRENVSHVIRRNTWKHV